MFGSLWRRIEPNIAGIPDIVMAMNSGDELRRQLEEAELELERFRMTLEITGVVDVEAGILNRNGVMDALERGRRWLARRGDLYGVIVVAFPRLAEIDADSELLKHLAATMAAGVREVDEVGRVDEVSFAAVLRDLQPDSIRIVVDRVERLAGRVASSVSALSGEYRLGAVEVHEPDRSAQAVLETALSLVDTPEGPKIATL